MRRGFLLPTPKNEVPIQSKANFPSRSRVRVISSPVPLTPTTLQPEVPNSNVQSVARVRIRKPIDPNPTSNPSPSSNPNPNNSKAEVPTQFKANVQSFPRVRIRKPIGSSTLSTGKTSSNSNQQPSEPQATASNQQATKEQLEECPICFDSKVNIKLDCGHEFCRACLRQLRNDTCPLCRKKINCSSDSEFSRTSEGNSGLLKIQAVKIREKIQSQLSIFLSLFQIDYPKVIAESIVQNLDVLRLSNSEYRNTKAYELTGVILHHISFVFDKLFQRLIYIRIKQILTVELE